MTDADALLKAVLAYPDDDAPRLIYADAIEDTDPARAAFIRVQCQLARVLGTSTGMRNLMGEWRERVADLQVREREILHDHEWDWLHAVCPELHRGYYEYATRTHHWLHPHDWVRGFLDSLELEAADWLAHADAILAAHPVRRVTLTTMPEGWPEPGTATRRFSALYALAARWLGITFALPDPEPVRVDPDRYSPTDVRHWIAPAG